MDYRVEIQYQVNIKLPQTWEFNISFFFLSAKALKCFVPLIAMHFNMWGKYVRHAVYKQKISLKTYDL